MNIRPATFDDCNALGIISVRASHSAYLGLIPKEDLDTSWTPEVSAENWRSFFAGKEWETGEFFVVAEVDKWVVGYIWAGAKTGSSEYERWVNSLYVLPSMHGKGVGRCLLRYTAERLMAQGVNSLLIGCAAINPNCGFYRHLGGVEVDRQPLTIDRFPTEEIFFGWSDLQPLIA
ncbi:MAG: GNAT family N-acetyltransferase [Chloroflexota bacterium]